MRTGSVRRGEVGARGPGRVPGYAARSCESSPVALGCTTADTEPKRARPIQVTQERPQVCRSQGRELPRVRWGDWTSRGGDTDPRTVTRLKGLGLSIRPKGCRRRPQRERAGMGRGGREMVGPLLCGKVTDQLEDKMRSSGSRGAQGAADHVWETCCVCPVPRPRSASQRWEAMRAVLPRSLLQQERDSGPTRRVPGVTERKTLVPVKH